MSIRVTSMIYPLVETQLVGVGQSKVLGHNFTVVDGDSG